MSTEIQGTETNGLDAFVFLGATGDLAYKQIFPALQRLVSDGRLKVLIVGALKPDWSDDELRRASPDDHGSIDDAAFHRLANLMSYVGGDYRDSATFAKLDKTWQRQSSAVLPGYSPDLFPVVI
ncbi:MAG: hypothetical protein R2849_22230 [Thermomicrobiales bacterium]